MASNIYYQKQFNDDGDVCNILLTMDRKAYLELAEYFDHDACERMKNTVHLYEGGTPCKLALSPDFFENLQVKAYTFNWVSTENSIHALRPQGGVMQLHSSSVADIESDGVLYGHPSREL